MNKIRVLIVDDDAGMLQLLSMRLMAMNYQPECVTSGAEALASLGKNLPDVLITDLRMEEMDGMTLFRTVHKRWPTLPVIIMTAHGTIREAVDATQEGVFSFLTKPVDKDELLTTLNQAVVTSSEATQGNESWGQSFNTCSAKMYQLLEQAQLLACSDVNVLIRGDSGTGKEVLARHMHYNSARREHPFVAINCSAIPSEVLESELFGHVKGAFTGASRDHEGLFASAQGGVLFLDEIGDMPLVLQAKLLRVLQERKVRPVGGTRDRAIDVRILSATHKNLAEAIANKEFREDLYYRLNVVTLALPSLNQRREDIPLLVQYFLAAISQRTKNQEKVMSPAGMQSLLGYSWPGNIRQLENVLEQVVALSPGVVISETLVANALPDKSDKDVLTLTDAKREFEKTYVEQLLKSTQGSVSKAAKLAGRNRSDFYKIVQRHSLHSEHFKKNE